MEYNQRLAIAKAMYAKPPGDDLPNQKFPRGTRVKVADEMPPHMSHFESGFEGIVEYTYGQKYGGDDINSYSLIVLNKEGQPINSIAWYYVSQLTLIDSNIQKGLEIINSYKLKRQ